MKDNVLLRTENMSRKYVISDRRETEIEVLKDINLEIREQEFISIMGKSGSTVRHQENCILKESTAKN